MLRFFSKHIIPAAVLTLLVAGCGPKLSIDGDTVRVGVPEGAKHCRLLGNTKISLNKVNAQLTSKDEIADRLEIEARNFTARLGGDTVAPFSEIEEASRIFKIYVCGKSGNESN